MDAASVSVSLQEDPGTDDQGLLAAARLFHAAAADDAEAVEATLRTAEVHVNSRDYEGRTALHVAAGRGSEEVVHLLLGLRADVGVVDRWGCTPMGQARAGGQMATEQLLRESGAVVEQEHLLQRALREHWQIAQSEVHLAKTLGSTFKSNLFLATWRGTQVVAKLPKGAHGPGGTAAGDRGPSVEALAVGARCALLGEDLECGPPPGAREVPLQPEKVQQLDEYHSDQPEHESRLELLREIELMASFRHPDLVPFLGACLEGAPVMCIMQYLPGGDLERYYKAKAREQQQQPYRPGLEKALLWSSAVARALWFLHDRRHPIVHRDLKPLNVLLTQGLEAKVTDFGISRHIRGPSCADGCKMSGGVGSWLYMAPEVVRYQAYTEKADVYSFAMLLFFMGSGRDPFHDLPSKESDACLKEYLKGREPRPDAKECPEALRPIMQDAWHVSADKRPAASELVRRLEGAVSKGPDQGCALL